MGFTRQFKVNEEWIDEKDMLSVFCRGLGVRCAACEGYCQDGEPCRITDNCPMMWCACHVKPAMQDAADG